MTYGCYETINNTSCYHEKAYNIAVILVQLSDYNAMLKEKSDT